MSIVWVCVISWEGATGLPTVHLELFRTGLSWSMLSGDPVACLTVQFGVGHTILFVACFMLGTLPPYLKLLLVLRSDMENCVVADLSVTLWRM